MAGLADTSEEAQDVDEHALEKNVLLLVGQVASPARGYNGEATRCGPCSQRLSVGLVQLVLGPPFQRSRIRAELRLGDAHGIEGR